MEIEPISSTTSTSTADRWRRLWEQRIQARQKATAALAADPAVVQAPPTAVDDGVDVELIEHPGTGAQMVRVVDSDSGNVVSEIPHHQVLDLVARLLEQNERGEEGQSDGEH